MHESKQNMTDSTEQQTSDFSSPHCGVIMPISPSDGYSAGHWADVLRLIQEAAADAGFTCDMVSGATSENDVIHANIITNIYKNEIAICDVSSRNPNVMLELGLRLASKKPVILIFDGQGSYPFDLNTIRYISYPRDMRYYDIQNFKKALTSKLAEVHQTYTKGEYQSFLSHFKAIDIDLDTVTSEIQPLKEFLERIDSRLANLENASNQTRFKARHAELSRAMLNYLREGFALNGTALPLSNEKLEDYRQILSRRFAEVEDMDPALVRGLIEIYAIKELTPRIPIKL